MYNFEQFSEKLIASVKKALEDKYGQADMIIQRKLKNNVELTGVICDVNGTEGKRISPSFYLEQSYDYYKAGVKMEEIISDLNAKLVAAIDEAEEIEKRARYIIKNPKNVVFQFMHTKQNEELLEQLPHREFHNLSIVYHCVENHRNEDSMSIPINHRVAELMGLNESELYELAYENTRQLQKAYVVPIKWVSIQLLVDGKENIDLEKLDFQEYDSTLPMYVVSNRHMNKGAVSILYTEKLHELAEQLESDLYLIPVSIHEMVVVPSDGPDLEELMNNLYENNLLMPLEERLSNDIYRYERRTQSIVQETDSEHKMLEETSIGDGMSIDMC